MGVYVHLASNELVLQLHVRMQATLKSLSREKSKPQPKTVAEEARLQSMVKVEGWRLQGFIPGGLSAKRRRNITVIEARSS